MEELLQNDSVIANVVWELVIRGAFVCYAFLYAAITRNLSKSSAMEDKLDPFAIVLFFIGAFPVWVIVGIYKGIKYLIKRRNEKRCFSHHTEGTFVHTLKFLFREDDHLMVNKYETIVEYYWDKQNGFCKKVTSVGYEKVFMTSKNGWEEVYRDESVDTNDNTRSSTKLSIKTIRFSALRTKSETWVHASQTHPVGNTCSGSNLGDLSSILSRMASIFSSVSIWCFSK